MVHSPKGFDGKPRHDIYSVKEILENVAFKNSFISASTELAIRKNTMPIMQTYCLLEILKELKEIKLLLDKTEIAEESPKKLTIKGKEK